VPTAVFSVLAAVFDDSETKPRATIRRMAKKKETDAALEALIRGDAARLRELFAGPGAAAALKRVGAELDEDDEGQLALLLELAPQLLKLELPDALFLHLVRAALGEAGPARAPMQAMPYGAPDVNPGEAVLAAVEPRVRKRKGLGDQLAYLAFQLSQEGRFEASIALFDRLVDVPGLDKTAYNNALWAVMEDNSKLAVQPERHRRFLAACLPHGPDNPAIFYNAACLYYELGELEGVFEQIRLALEHGYSKPEQIRNEPLFAPIADDPRFAAAFGDEA